MTDPIGLLGQPDPAARAASTTGRAGPAGRGASEPGAPSFRDLMLEELREVNDLGQEATAAAEDFATGRRTDYDGVIDAARKADLAFQMLLQVRNKVLDAYHEVKQIHV